MRGTKKEGIERRTIATMLLSRLGDLRICQARRRGNLEFGKDLLSRLRESVVHIESARGGED